MLPTSVRGFFLRECQKNEVARNEIIKLVATRRACDLGVETLVKKMLFASSLSLFNLLRTERATGGGLTPRDGASTGLHSVGMYIRRTNNQSGNAPRDLQKGHR